jgi:hypothetical protein
MTIAAVLAARTASLFAGPVLGLGDGSSLRTIVTGTVRLGRRVRREAESEGTQCHNSDSMNRGRIEGRIYRVSQQ